MKKVNEFSVLSMILDLQLAGKTVKQLSPRTSRNAVIKFAQAHCRLFWRENFKLVLNGLCSEKVKLDPGIFVAVVRKRKRHGI